MNGKEIINVVTDGDEPSKLQKALNKLAKSKANGGCGGLSCYCMNGPSSRYKCPYCGKTTNYTYERWFKYFWQHKYFCLGVDAKLQKFGINIGLDDREFCSFCTPEWHKEGFRPRRKLVISRLDAKGHIIPSSSYSIPDEPDDWEILCAFFEGKEEVFLGPEESSKALKNFIPRIAEILRLEIPDSN